jgi:hypothetical protein
MAPSPATHTPAEGVVTLDQWVERATHTVTLPSGAVVKIRLPDLSLLLAGQRVPERLRVLALEQVMGAIEGKPEIESEDGSATGKLEKQLGDLAELNFWLVSQMVVEPELTSDVLREGRLPNEDVEMLIALATRDTDEDALGVRLGVVPLERFDGFRDVGDGAARGQVDGLGDPVPGPGVGEV